jgi:PAS domain S-box-containing protein
VGLGEVVLGEGGPTALREGSWSGETALLSSEGEEIPVSQVILAHRDPGGKIRFLSTTARDITDRKRAEDELARSRRLFASIAEATPDLLYVSELAGGRNVYANRQAERILGYDQEQLMAFGGSINDKIVHTEDKARALAAWAGLASLGDGEVQEHEFRARHSDGRYPGCARAT